MTAIALPIPSATGSLDSYIQTVNRFPILTQEEETALARDRKSTRLNSSHVSESRMPSSA